MFESVRARLTLWYTGVLALVLVSFAFASYLFLAATLNRRTDGSLTEMSSAFALTLETEQRELDSGEVDLPNNHTGSSNRDAAAIEAISEYRLNDYQFVLYNDGGQVIAASPGFISGREHTPSPVWTVPPISSGITSLLRWFAGQPSGASRFVTLADGSVAYRARAQRVQAGPQPYTLVVLRSLHDQNELLEGASGALSIAVPLALLLASLGGYLLARKSLAPVVVMSDKAARIGAANLHERLPVANERDELGKLATVFNALLARLNESFDQQRRFMADASHELRTPVAIVRGEAEVSLSQPERSADDYRESLGIVHDEGRRLTRIVEDLFTLARADAGQHKLRLNDFYLDELADEVVRSVRTLVAKRSVSLSLHAPQELPFRGDEVLVRRLLLNLLDNSIKYTSAGGSIAVTCESLDGNYIVTIADTGSGIALDDQPHIFERFFRADKARTRAITGDEVKTTSGAGLGLSIAQWVATAHHGELKLLNSSELGTTFVVLLPAPKSPGFK